jgi:hypothetical protein
MHKEKPLGKGGIYIGFLQNSPSGLTVHVYMDQLLFEEDMGQLLVRVEERRPPKC